MAKDFWEIQMAHEPNHGMRRTYFVKTTYIDHRNAPAHEITKPLFSPLHANLKVVSLKHEIRRIRLPNLTVAS